MTISFPFRFSKRFISRVAAVVWKLTFALATLAGTGSAVAAMCSATSGPAITPVIELFTSEGCSSCPPADKWASTLKRKNAVVQAFHVGYWDYIGWVDRFAAPAHTVRQREVAARNSLGSIYTPQAVLDGKDWQNWRSVPLPQTSNGIAQLTIAVT